MAAQKGRLFLLKRGTASGGTTIAGMRTTRMTLNNQAVDITNKDSAGWRNLLEGAGTQSVSISAEGVFTDSAVEESLRSDAFSNAIDAYGVLFGNGDQLDGNWQITSYERGGNHDGEEVCSITLESAGTMTFTTA